MSERTLYLILPFPPSMNTYWRHVGKRTLLCAAGRDYRKKVARELRWRPFSFGSQRLRVTVAMVPPDKRRRDLDNFLKAPLDALLHAGVYDDDGQIDHLVVERRPPDKSNPRLEVTIEVV